MSKKGFVMTSFLIGIIIIVASAFVIFLFVSNLDFRSNINREVCHDSVVKRATLPNLIREGVDEYVPLNCVTNKICFSSSVSDCEDSLGKKTSENNINLVSISDKDKEEVLDRMANELYDCHSMLGEGKINFMSRRSSDEHSCMICSRIVFSDEEYQVVKDVKLSEFYNYLYSKKDTSGKSYLENIYGIKEPAEASIIFDSIVSAQEKKNSEIEEVKFADLKMFNSKDTVIISQMVIPGRLTSYLSGAGVGGGVFIIGTAAILALPVSWPVALVGVGTIAQGAAATSVLTFWYTSPDGYVYSPPVVLGYEEKFDKLGCTSYEFDG